MNILRASLKNKKFVIGFRDLKKNQLLLEQYLMVQELLSFTFLLTQIHLLAILRG